MLGLELAAAVLISGLGPSLAFGVDLFGGQTDRRPSPFATEYG
jgi:hypothetical protein